MLEQILYALAKIGAITALGAFIDFMMSKREKKMLLGWLETGWLKFSEVPWKRLGRTEAASAIAVWDVIVGDRLLSLKRLFVSLVIVELMPVIALVSRPNWMRSLADLIPQDQSTWAGLIVFTFATMVSLSITRFSSRLVVESSDRYAVIAPIALLAFNIILYLYWARVSATLSWTISKTIANWPNLSLPWLVSDWKSAWSFLGDDSKNVAFQYLSFTLNGLRLCFSALFVAGFIVAPLLHSFVLRLWARIVESEKPIFALALGGVSSAIIIAHELIRLVSA
ncbi:hypothetical protein [Reyranella sp.]|uniref:hypothetical protein n=1 Tax=Reyranella sp. TaxID=1929291 RepID=UPI003D0E272F